jgi:hypothetical protein
MRQGNSQVQGRKKIGETREVLTKK